MSYFENGRRGGGRRASKKKTKSYSAKQMAAQETARRVFARARQIWSAVPRCDPYEALRQAWAEVKSGRAAANPLRLLRTNPSGIEIVEDGGKFHIYMDGAPTGKYFLTRARAEEKASRM
jgi:hypothetical protein